MAARKPDGEELLLKHFKTRGVERPPLKAKRYVAGEEISYHIPLFDLDLVLMQLFFLGIPSASFFIYGCSDGWSTASLVFWFLIILITVYLTFNNIYGELVIKTTHSYLEYTWFLFQPFPKRITYEEIAYVGIKYKKLQSADSDATVFNVSAQGGLDSFTINFYDSKRKWKGKIGRMIPGIYVAYLYEVLRSIPHLRFQKYGKY